MDGFIPRSATLSAIAHLALGDAVAGKLADLFTLLRAAGIDEATSFSIIGGRSICPRTTSQRDFVLL
jgi:hypothetical protein